MQLNKILEILDAVKTVTAAAIRTLVSQSWVGSFSSTNKFDFANAYFYCEKPARPTITHPSCAYIEWRHATQDVAESRIAGRGAIGHAGTHWLAVRGRSVDINSTTTAHKRGNHC